MPVTCVSSFCSGLRNLLGEDLGPLNVKELDQLEHQLEASLNQIRCTKLEQISKENHLRQSFWGGSEQGFPFGQQHAQPHGFFQPLGCNPTLQAGYNPEALDQMTPNTHAQVGCFIPEWML
ncbi:hypothetical protein Nepgr_029081 [Nepenthes gracilis]|uniref:K-box domain-containing protein n=1 Tax=Nepenthes gracilis TaxID=150966 RepID=A0AAD3Y2Z3_NEPGR|nr:hypothetical protein Nepgr_029081 [Nepenthes gracilis]